MFVHSVRRNRHWLQGVWIAKWNCEASRKTSAFRELVKKIESHPHWEGLPDDLQKNNVYNPFSNNSKAMIREMGNVYIFELCETVPSKRNPKFSNKLRLDCPFIPHYVIKKARLHGARHGKTVEQKEYHLAFNAWKRCCIRVDGHEEHYEGIHDRFLRDQVYRESQLNIGWTEQKCIEIDKLAQEDNSYRLSRGIQETLSTVVSHIELIGQKCTEPTSISLPSCSHNQKPSPPRMRQRTCNLIRMVIHVVRLSVRSLTLCSSPCSFPCFSYLFFFYMNPKLNFFLHVSSPGQYTTGIPPTEESGTWAERTPLTQSTESRRRWWSDKPLQQKKACRVISSCSLISFSLSWNNSPTLFQGWFFTYRKLASNSCPFKNCCLKSGIQRKHQIAIFTSYSSIRVVMLSSADFPDDREYCFRMTNCGWRHV